MKNNKKEAYFKKKWQRILKERSPHFLHLTCRKCGTEAHAASLEIADLFGGWTKVKHQQGLDHTGLCIECSYPNSPKSRKKRRKL